MDSKNIKKHVWLSQIAAITKIVSRYSDSKDHYGSIVNCIIRHKLSSQKFVTKTPIKYSK